MAYVPDDLALVINPSTGKLPRVFIYRNAAPDSDATITGAGFFSDGVPKGMRVGDIVDVMDTGTAKYKRYQVTSVSGDAATVAAPTAIT